MLIAAHEQTRSEPPLSGTERETLTGFIQFFRDALEWKCSGLDDAQLQAMPISGSTMSLLGLLRHLTEVERQWANNVIAGQDLAPLYFTDAHPDGDFEDLSSTPTAEVFAAWKRQQKESDRILGDIASLDELRVRQRRSGEETVSVRWILVHLVEEYARHVGHADFLRELIDGVTGE